VAEAVFISLITLNFEGNMGTNLPKLIIFNGRRFKCHKMLLNQLLDSILPGVVTGNLLFLMRFIQLKKHQNE